VPNPIGAAFEWIFRAAVVFLLAMIASPIAGFPLDHAWAWYATGACLTIVPGLLLLEGLVAALIRRPPA